MRTADIDPIGPIWRWLAFAAIVAAAASLAFSGAHHAVAAHWAASSDPAQWLRAAQMEPSNADRWYELARYRQLDFAHSDLPLALDYYRRATSLNPGSPFYWMDFAGAYESAGDVADAEQAFRKARGLYPISADAAWRFGNFLLRQGRVPEAFQQIHDALAVDSKLTVSAISVCWSSTRDIDQILKAVLPDGPDENWGAIQFFVQAREPLAALAVWRRIAAHHDSFPAAEAFPLLDMLIATGHVDEARVVWSQALQAAGAPRQSDAGGSLVWNGGFENDPLDGGFDWRFFPVEGAEIRWDEEYLHSGRRSLRVDFDGKTNVDFANVWQYVPVSPSTTYRFSAFFRTDDLTTDSGIHFDIRDVSRPGTPVRSTPNLLGSQSWAEQKIEMVTGPDTSLLQIVLRRTRSDKLGNKIRGTAWIDDVALVPATNRARKPR